jgi:UDP-N-acetylmuramate--alanine ligase
MHVFFSGIGGTAISSLALIAHQAGYEVSGSDARPSGYLDYLAKHGITNTHIGVDDEFISNVHAGSPIDWFVYGSAQPMDFPDHPEFDFCKQKNIKMSKRDEFLSLLIKEKGFKLIAIAGTHGKTTTTAMVTWLYRSFDLPISYSGGAKLSFGDVAHFDPKSEYFVYEADEYDRNFLSFYPELSLISGVDYDHPDIYPTRESYEAAFLEFLEQSNHNFLWHDDAEKLGLEVSKDLTILDEKDPQIDTKVKLAGRVNRLDAWLVAKGLQDIIERPFEDILQALNSFPGVSRRFEMIAANIYSDSAHTPPKIRGALQLAREVAGDNVIVVYEGLHNTRQHFIKDELNGLFTDVKKLYIVPSYLAREDKNLELLTPDKLLNMLSNSTRSHSKIAELDDNLKIKIQKHAEDGDLVLCLSGGGSGSLDEWLRQGFTK